MVSSCSPRIEKVPFLRFRIRAGHFHLDFDLVCLVEVDGQADLALAFELALIASEKLFSRRGLFRPTPVVRLGDPVSPKPVHSDGPRIFGAVVADLAGRLLRPPTLDDRKNFGPRVVFGSWHDETPKRVLQVVGGHLDE